MKKSKKLMLGTIAAMGALAIGAGAVSTFAWYSATNNATVSAKTFTEGSISTVASSLSVNDYKINVTVEAVSGIELSNIDSSKLYKGIYANGQVRTEQVTANPASNFIKAYTITASWDGGAPTDPVDVAYLKGKTVTGGTLTADGYVHFMASQDCSGTVTDGGQSATYTISIANADGLALTVNVADSKTYIRVQAKAPTGEDTVADHADDAVTPAGTLAI